MKKEEVCFKLIELYYKNIYKSSSMSLRELVEKKQQEKHDEYSKNVNGYRFTDRDFS